MIESQLKDYNNIRSSRVNLKSPLFKTSMTQNEDNMIEVNVEEGNTYLHTNASILSNQNISPQSSITG